ncbi:MAG TPA: anti-sigma factor [Xanthobacteraceae bacterium]|nr:anti-sigma factor [Xanthobacteraceae bacterium]
MKCAEAEVLLHALIDRELDAGHAREVEAHIAECPRCAAQLRAFTELHGALAAEELRLPAPPGLRRRIEAALPAPAREGTSRRSMLKGFALGTALSTALAASLVLVIVQDDRSRRVRDEVVAAHLRSLQANHLLDVQSTDRHTVKPWFNGRVDVAPPVIDLVAQGFTLLGGRLDYIEGRTVCALVYRRRQHIINLFVAQRSSGDLFAAKDDAFQGYNIRHWSAGGLEFWAVSDLAADELQEFVDKFRAQAPVDGRT